MTDKVGSAASVIRVSRISKTAGLRDGSHPVPEIRRKVVQGRPRALGDRISSPVPFPSTTTIDMFHDMGMHPMPSGRSLPIQGRQDRPLLRTDIPIATAAPANPRQTGRVDCRMAAVTWLMVVFLLRLIA